MFVSLLVQFCHWGFTLCEYAQMYPNAGFIQEQFKLLCTLYPSWAAAWKKHVLEYLEPRGWNAAKWLEYASLITAKRLGKQSLGGKPIRMDQPETDEDVEPDALAAALDVPSGDDEDEDEEGGDDDDMEDAASSSAASVAPSSRAAASATFDADMIAVQQDSDGAWMRVSAREVYETAWNNQSRVVWRNVRIKTTLHGRASGVEFNDIYNEHGGSWVAIPKTW